MVPPLQRRLTLADSSALAALLESRSGLIAIDGCPGAGKSTLGRQLAEALGCSAVDCDCYLNEDRRAYVAEIRIDDLAASIAAAEAASRLVLVAGVCVLAVLARIGRSADTLVYVERLDVDGFPADRDALAAENGAPDDHDAIIAELRAAGIDPGDAGSLDREVNTYHRDYRPRASADVIFLRRERETDPASS